VKSSIPHGIPYPEPEDFGEGGFDAGYLAQTTATLLRADEVQIQAAGNQPVIEVINAGPITLSGAINVLQNFAFTAAPTYVNGDLAAFVGTAVTPVSGLYVTDPSAEGWYQCTASATITPNVGTTAGAYAEMQVTTQAIGGFNPVGIGVYHARDYLIASPAGTDLFIDVPVYLTYGQICALWFIHANASSQCAVTNAYMMLARITPAVS
jgi:hypothetical protein